MKKFSKVTNHKIKEEPILNNEINKEEYLKYQILELASKFLKIRSYGPLDDKHFFGDVEIEGKEMLADAIINLFNQEFSNNKKSILESLKKDMSDWKLIDDKINELSKSDIDFKNQIKFNKILERHDQESLLLFLTSNVNKITNKKTLIDYKFLIEKSNLSDNIKKNIINLYNKKIRKM